MNETPARSSAWAVLRRLLRGSRRYFILCILAGTLLSVCELAIPQVIRVTVDSLIGSAPVDLPDWGLALIRAMGGVEGLRAHMWAVALLLGATPAACAGRTGVGGWVGLVYRAGGTSCRRNPLGRWEG